MQQLWNNRRRAASWVVAALVLAGCKSSTSPSTSGPTGLFKGTFVSGGASGVLTLTFPAAAPTILAASLLPLPHFPTAAAAAATSITGTLALTGGGTVTLNGTYDASANPQLTVAGGGYTISGNFTAASGQFSGSFTGPSGNGQWTASAGGTTVRVFCGTYSGGASGTWNLVLDNNNMLSGVANTSKGAVQLSGSYSGGAVTVSWSGGTASGTLSTTTGAGSGTWAATGGGSGNWTANTTGC